MKSIINDRKVCFCCQTTLTLEYHHVFFGGRNRKKSDDDGLTVWLCYRHHRGTFGVHGKNGHELDLILKKIGEMNWCKYYKKTPIDFIKRYGRNYL